MGGINNCTCGIVTIPRPIGTTRNADSIDAKEVGGSFDIDSILNRIAGLHIYRITFAVLQQHEGSQQTALRKRCWTFARIPTTRGRLLLFFAHDAKLRAREHVGAFGDEGHVWGVDVGGWVVHAFEFFVRVWAIGEVAFGVGVAVTGRFGVFASANFVGIKRRLIGGAGLIGCDIQCGGDDSEAKTRAKDRIGGDTVLDGCKASGDRCACEVDV